MRLYPSGTRIAGRFEVAGRPLIGGMGIVYLCVDHATDRRPVALKTFKPEYLPDRAARDRFLREGTTWISLGAHPHIVRAHEVVYTGDGHEVYIVLEFVAKEPWCKDASLDSYLVGGRSLPVRQALLFGLQVARGMKYATTMVPGLVHRDLKPLNVLVGADLLTSANVNRVRVTDFGLAKVLEETGPTMADAASETSAAGGPEVPAVPSRTQLTRGAVGTWGYMAPEQWHNDTLSAATDVYALGCILVEMRNGRPAVTGGSWDDLKRAHCEGRAREAAENLAGEVRELVLRCVEVDPQARWANWAEVEKALAEVYGQASGEGAPQPAETGKLSRAERVAAGWSQSSIGASYLDIGKADVAQGYFERALEAGRTEGELELEGAALGNLGTTFGQLGRAREAIDYTSQSLEIARKIRDRHGEGNSLCSLGTLHALLGEALYAIAYYEQALAIQREVRDPWGVGKSLSGLGLAYARLGDPRRAIGYYEEALAIQREIRDRQGEGQTLGNLGNACADIGDASGAIGRYKQRLEIAREIGDLRGEGAALGNLATVYKHIGEAWRAVEYYEQALAILRRIEDRQGEGRVLSGLGRAYAELDDAQRAIGYYEQALTILCETDDRLGEGGVLHNLGAVYAQLGSPQRAIGYYERALRIAREVADRVGEASVSFDMALLHQQQGDLSRGLQLAQEAARLFAEIGHAAYAQRAQELVAQLRRDSQRHR